MRILSIKAILSDPEKFGFKLEKNDYYRPLVFDKVRIKSAGNLPVRIVAEAAVTRFKVIKDLNPEIRGHYLPSGTREILVPKGASKGFQKRLKLLVKSSALSQNEHRSPISRPKRRVECFFVDEAGNWAIARVRMTPDSEALAGLTPCVRLQIDKIGNRFIVELDRSRAAGLLHQFNILDVQQVFSG